MRADLGVMISASHNPYEDNGIKLFGPDGYKLSDEVERQIEALIDADLLERCSPRRPDRPRQAHRRARRRATSSSPSARCRASIRLDGLRVVVDCANGAAYKVAPEALWELGAEVDRDRRRARRPQHQPRRAARPRRRRCPTRCASCAPTSASRSTATPTGVVIVDEKGQHRRRRPAHGA